MCRVCEDKRCGGKRGDDERAESKRDGGKRDESRDDNVSDVVVHDVPREDVVKGEAAENEETKLTRLGWLNRRSFAETSTQSNARSVPEIVSTRSSFEKSKSQTKRWPLKEGTAREGVPSEPQPPKGSAARVVKPWVKR
jgi:hypothetical protein